MDTERVIQFLTAITDLSAAFIREIELGLQHEFYKSHQIIHAGGQIENRLWYLKSGVARSYIYDENGHEHTIRFWNKDEIIFSYAGFWKKPSPEYIEVIRESNLYSFTYENLELLNVNYRETSVIIRAIVWRYHQQEYKRNKLYALSTEERYRQFRKEHAHIFQSVSLRIIASYLHMSRENLSRIISKEQH
jgi:CRP-like cAMP-binding protein